MCIQQPLDTSFTLCTINKGFERFFSNAKIYFFRFFKPVHSVKMHSMMKHSNSTHSRSYPRVRALLNNPGFTAVILILVLLSVALLFVESFGECSSSTMDNIQLANDIITVFLVIELFMRWLIASTTRKFFSNHWIDCLAILPMLRIFRFGRIAYLLRLFRVFSLGTLIQRRLIHFANSLGSRFLEYGIIFGFMVFAILFGTIGLAQFETTHSDKIITQSDAFWQAVFSLLSGEYADYPATLGGKLVFLLLLLFGMSFFAMLTGTISAVMIEKLKESGMHKVAKSDEFADHVVICGFSSKLGILLSELLSVPEYKNREIVIVSECINAQDLQEMGISNEAVLILQEDFTHVEAMNKACIQKAKTAIILSEPSKNRTTHDIDARTLLAALTIEKLNPDVHTCAEIYHQEYVSHLKMGGVDDVIIHGEVSGRLLARVGSHRGLMSFFKEILDFNEGNTLLYLPIPEQFTGQDFQWGAEQIKKSLNALLVGVKPNREDLILNPSTHIFKPQDEMLVIADPKTVNLKKLKF
jgi:voltage-gated potassium channel